MIAMNMNEELYDYEKTKLEDEDQDEDYEESLQSRIFESLYASTKESQEVNT